MCFFSGPRRPVLNRMRDDNFSFGDARFCRLGDMPRCLISHDMKVATDKFGTKSLRPASPTIKEDAGLASGSSTLTSGG